jgi:predicted metal-dependent phosphoesterase TrpH
LILTETHLHTRCSSSCGKVHPSGIVGLYKKAGYGAIIVTDHYFDEKWGKYNENTDDWLNSYRMMKSAGEKSGIKVFLGMELRFNKAIEDFLVYGFDEKFLKKNRLLYQLKPRELYEFLDSYGFLIYQAHPFRTGYEVCDPAYLHGIEIFNGNPRHTNRNEKAMAFAEKHELLKISGSDFHQVQDVGSGGIYLDETVETEKELAQYLKKLQKTALYQGTT